MKVKKLIDRDKGKGGAALMDDQRIIELFMNRDEQAIQETIDKYGTYIRKIAANILGNREDTEECVNDSLLRVWNTIPPNQPKKLSAYLALLTRQISIDAYRKSRRKKRSDTEYSVSYEEMSEVLADRQNETEELIDRLTFQELLNRFLSGRPKDVRTILVLRYFYLEPTKDIAERTGSSESRVRVVLHRERKALKKFLAEEGYEL